MSINLENFEFAHISQSTPDVLTSPRSLKASFQLSIAVRIQLVHHRIVNNIYHKTKEYFYTYFSKLSLFLKFEIII
jgi:hypothetical protein